MNRNAMLETLKQFGGQSNTIVIPRAFVDFTGTLEAAMMLSQLLYWSERDGGRGRVAKSDKDWKDELCLTQYAVRQARKTLENMGIIKTEVHRFNGTPTVHYALQEDVLLEKWILWIQKNDFAKSQNRTLRNRKIPNRDYTETTTDSPPTAGETSKSPKPLQPCGHPISAIRGTDEGTPYCAECRAATEFDALPSASAGVSGNGARTAAVASPRAERAAQIERIAEALILLVETTHNIKLAARKMLDDYNNPEAIIAAIDELRCDYKQAEFLRRAGAMASINPILTIAKRKLAPRHAAPSVMTGEEYLAKLAQQVHR